MSTPSPTKILSGSNHHIHNHHLNDDQNKKSHAKKRKGSRSASAYASSSILPSTASLSSSSSSSITTTKTFAYLLLGTALILGSVQWSLNAILMQMLESTSATHDIDPNTGLPVVPLQEQLARLQYQVHQFQHQVPNSIYVEDGNFYPFSIRDSRRLVPTQLPVGFHIWDYVDITAPNQQRTQKATLFHNAQQVAPAICQSYDLLCYKEKILQVFDIVLEQNPYTQYFFYMEADNELCVPLTEIRRHAYQYQRYFITTGIGFSGWIMKRTFMVDFLDALRNYQPPPRDPKDILTRQGPTPSEGPDPIASVLLIEKQAWTVTRKYLVSHSIQPSLGVGALTVKMPGADAVQESQPQPMMARTSGNSTVTTTTASAAALSRLFPLQAAPSAARAAQAIKGLEKHLPRCLEPRRSKWRISKTDHRDRFGWDYFDYDECDGEVFPCYEGQLEELLARDMAKYNYTALDLERQKLISKQQDRQRQKMIQGQTQQTIQQHMLLSAPQHLSPPQVDRSEENRESRRNMALAAIHGGMDHGGGGGGDAAIVEMAKWRQEKVALAAQAIHRQRMASAEEEKEESSSSQHHHLVAAAAAATGEGAEAVSGAEAGAERKEDATANVVRPDPLPLADRRRDRTDEDLADGIRLRDDEERKPQPQPLSPQSWTGLGGGTRDGGHPTIHFFPGGGNPSLRGGTGTL